jgi:hypothetical protein
MPAGELVVDDTSPLLNLSLVGRLDLVDDQFETIHVPEQVWGELTAGDEDVPGLRALRDAGTLTVVPVDRSDLYAEIVHELDAGEPDGSPHEGCIVVRWYRESGFPEVFCRSPDYWEYGPS